MLTITVNELKFSKWFQNCQCDNVILSKSTFVSNNPNPHTVNKFSSSLSTAFYLIDVWRKGRWVIKKYMRLYTLVHWKLILTFTITLWKLTSRGTPSTFSTSIRIFIHSVNDSLVTLSPGDSLKTLDNTCDLFEAELWLVR